MASSAASLPLSFRSPGLGAAAGDGVGGAAAAGADHYSDGDSGSAAADVEYRAASEGVVSALLAASPGFAALPVDAPLPSSSAAAGRRGMKGRPSRLGLGASYVSHNAVANAGGLDARMQAGIRRGHEKRARRRLAEEQEAAAAKRRGLGVVALGAIGSDGDDDSDTDDGLGLGRTGAFVPTPPPLSRPPPAAPSLATPGSTPHQGKKKKKKMKVKKKKKKPQQQQQQQQQQQGNKGTGGGVIHRPS